MNDEHDLPPLPTPHEALLALRERAEKRRHLVTQAVTDKSPGEVQRLVQELQTHQIELEMQYEELLLAQTEAERARAEFVNLYDFAPVGYLTLDAHGIIRQLNLRAAQQLGSIRQRLLGQRLALFVAAADQATCAHFLQQLRAPDLRRTCELQMRRQDNTAWYALLEGTQELLPEHEPQYRVALLDVTDRRLTRDALAASEARFRRLFEQSADAVLLVRDLHIVDCNQAALRVVGATSKEQLLHRPVSYLVPEFQPDGEPSGEAIRRHYQALQAQGTHRFEWYRYNLQGQAMWLEIVLTYINVSGEQLIHVVWRDITCARAAREQLRAEKEFTKSLLDNSVDAVVALDRDGIITAWNREAERYSGRTEAQVLGKSLFELFPQFGDHAGLAGFRQVLATGERTMRANVPFVNHPGHYDAYMVPLRSEALAAITGVLVVVRDITERNRMQEETTRLHLTRQQEVLSAILATQEAERKRIAEALHNGVGQLLYATKLHLQRSTDPNRDKSLTLLEDAIRMTRTISFELTPGILEDFGLEYALGELIRRIPQASLKASLHVSGLEAPLPKLLEVAVYRMVQELFNNIIKHAGAQEAFIHVVREADQLSISVEDNGVGFSPGPLPDALPGIGLPGIRSRVGLLGGTLNIASRPGQGTIISIELPVR